MQQSTNVLLDLAAHRRQQTGRAKILNSHKTRAKGAWVQPPAAPPPLSLMGDERAATAIVLGVGSSNKPFTPRHRVAGRSVPHRDVANLLARNASLFLLVNSASIVAELQQLQQPGLDVDGAGSSSGAADCIGGSTILFHGAAVASQPGVLAATRAFDLTELADASVQPGSQLWERFLELAVSSRDALDAARTAAVLLKLTLSVVVGLLSSLGVSILAPELPPRLKEGQELGWLRHTISLAADDTAGAALLAAARTVSALGYSCMYCECLASLDCCCCSCMRLPSCKTLCRCAGP